MEEDTIAPGYDPDASFGEVKDDNEVRKQEWFWPKLIHDRLFDKMGYNLDRTNIKDILETCCNNDDKLVERRTAIIEPKAKFEYRLTDSGKELLIQMNNPNYLFNKLNK